MSKYDRVCTKCKGKLKASDGMVIDSYPSIQPVVCTDCGLRQHAYLTSEVEEAQINRDKENA